MTLSKPLYLKLFTTACLVPLSLSLGTMAQAQSANKGAPSPAFGQSEAANAAAGCNSTAPTGGANATQCGVGADAAGGVSTAVGFSASALGIGSIALGNNSDTIASFSTALGNNTQSGLEAIAIGDFAEANGTGSVAIGGDPGPGLEQGARADGSRSIVIGADANDGGFARAIVVGHEVTAAEADQIILGTATKFNMLGNGNLGLGTAAPDRALHINSTFPRIRLQDSSGFPYDWEMIATAQNFIFHDITADTFPFALREGAPTNSLIVRENGDVGMGTDNPMGSLDINSGAADTTLLLSNTSAQWEMKSKASTGRLNFKNLIAGGVPFKLGPNSVNGLLSVGTAAADLVEVRGELMVEGDVDVTGTLTTGGPTCGGGCDAVFGADYDLPSIEEHAEAMYANSYLPQVGPTVPHAPMNISEKVGDMLNELEKAHIYISQLETEARHRDLRLETQNARLARLEALAAR